MTVVQGCQLAVLQSSRVGQSCGPVIQELNNYLTLETQTSMIVDRSAQGDLLRINFNISFPALSCEFATLDVSDALGTVGQGQRTACGLMQLTVVSCEATKKMLKLVVLAETLESDKNCQKAANQ